MLSLVATNVIASQPPKRGPTGTPHARAKIDDSIKEALAVYKLNGVGGPKIISKRLFY